MPAAESTEPVDPYFEHRKQQAATMQPHRPYEKCDTLKQVPQKFLSFSSKLFIIVSCPLFLEFLAAALTPRA